MAPETHAAKSRDPMNEKPHYNATTVVEGDRALLIERTFQAPPALVFAAWTKPELVKQWWAPQSHGVEMAEVTADLRVGGKYRYVMRDPQGGEIAFSGEYREISPPDRLVYTQIFEPMAHAGAVICTVSFLALPGGKTKLSSREVYPSKEALDAALSSGMEHGMNATMDQLDALLPTLSA